MLNKEHIKLYLKIFLILFTAGIVLPYIINHFFGNILLIEDKAPYGNSIFVMYNNDCQGTFLETFFEILAKYLEF